MTHSIGIWPPHEAFYIEGMLFCTAAALAAADDVDAALESGARHSTESPEWQESARTVLDGIQALTLHAAALSRYFWPSSPKDVVATARAVALRRGLEVPGDSPLRDRGLRNALEHFDERLDAFCQSLVAGVILPTYVGPLEADPEVPAHHFRAYYTDVGVFEILGRRFEVVPLLDEVERIHDRLLECVRQGSRVTRPHVAG